MKTLFLFLLLISCQCLVYAQNNADEILGKWMSVQNNCMVDVYKNGQEYRAKIIWFDDSDDPSRPMNERLDIENPDKKLRSQKILGSNVLKELIYNYKNKVWKNGYVYDATSGRTWNASVWLLADGTLKVRGYWHFQFLGQNLFFKRVN
ncbi:MAG: DUF2147 domain-containing protein [Ginsengibacter sp.]